MIDILKKDKLFKEALGAFIIAFSEVEFGLAFLCSLTGRHTLLQSLQKTLNVKRACIKDFIEEQNLSELTGIWQMLNEEIGVLNHERRFLAHGFMQYTLPVEGVTTGIVVNGKYKKQKPTIKEMNELTQRLYRLNSGENGINGQFFFLFKEVVSKQKSNN